MDLIGSTFRRLSLLTLLLLFPLAVPCANAQSEQAYFIYRLASFTYWKTEQPTLHFAVVGNPTVAEELSSLLKSERIRGKAVEVSAISAGDNLPSFDLIYFSGPVPEAAVDFLKSPQMQGTLTMGDPEGFLDLGGTVLLRKRNARLEFEVDKENMARGGVMINARALSLARKVH